MKRTVTSFSQQQILQQQQQQQSQMNQNVITKPPYTRNENHISTTNFPKNRQNQLHYDEPTTKAQLPQHTDTTSLTVIVGSADPSSTNTKPSKQQSNDVCVRCHRTVYKMVAVIAENRVWHRSCFRCNECDKQLNRHSKVDSFQIHGGVLYCQFHFNQLFGQKDVRPSEQYHGHQDIQTDAVKTRFQKLDKISTNKKETTEEWQGNIKRGATILSKMEKFHAKGMDVGVTDFKTNEKDLKNDLNDDNSIQSEDSADESDVDLARAKRILCKLPLTFDNVNEIKDKFEAGMDQGREARRLERKQELQDIRSRVYIGKQARTRVKFENAVASLETNPKLRNRGLLMDYELDNVRAAAEKTRNVKQRFESGDVYRRGKSLDKESSITSQIFQNVTERTEMLAKRQAQDVIVKSNAKVKFIEKPDILNQWKFFENCLPEKQKGYSIKIDGVNIGSLKMGGTVAKATNAYIGRLKKSKTIDEEEESDITVQRSYRAQSTRGARNR